MDLTSSEQEITKIFIERAHILCQQYDMQSPDWKCSIKFLMARKFDINRALQLYRNHELIREKEDLKAFDPFADDLRKELSSTKFSIIIGKQDPSFPTIAIFRAKLHDPLAVSTKTVLRALVFHLDCALESLQTQRNGLIFVYDMSDSKYRNFDLDLSQKILNLLKGAYPARLKKILIISAPFWFRAPFNLLRLIIPEKLWNRVWICEPSQLPFHVPLQYLPADFGGTGAPYDHRGWLMHCFKCYTDDKDMEESRTGQTRSQSGSPCREGVQAEKQSPDISPLNGRRKGTPELIRFPVVGKGEGEYNASSLPMVLSPPPFGTKAQRLISAKGSPIHSNNHHSSAYRSLSTTPTVPKDDKSDAFKFPVEGSERFHWSHSSQSANKPPPQHRELIKDPFEIETPDPHLNFLPPSELKQLVLIAIGKETMDITQLIDHVIEVGGRDGLYKEYSDLTTELNEFHKLRRLQLKKAENGLPRSHDNSVNSDPYYSFENFALKSNASKNRYSDVMCFDHTRVILRRKNKLRQLGPGESQEDEGISLTTPNNLDKSLKNSYRNNIGEEDCYSDEETEGHGNLGVGDSNRQNTWPDHYINANYVDGFNRPRVYISTQGPLPKTFEDFWCMCWENRILTIVMTTKVSERGRVKCGEYWPTTVGASVKHGPYHVKLLDRHVYPTYVQSQLKLTCHKSPKGGKEEALTITHLQFTSWPDYGVPASASDLLQFRDMVKRSQELNYDKHRAEHPNPSSTPPPVLVHCSAGIGRTGTFITIDICIEQLMAFGKINIRHVVRRIRSQRAFSIQMPDQYVFCHTAILEFANREGMIPDNCEESFNKAIQLNHED